MNYSTAIFLINDKVRMVKATFQEDGGKAYFYKTLDPTIAVDDYAVVKTNTTGNILDLCTVKIVEIDVPVDYDSNIPYKWLVDRINQSEYKDILLLENNAVEKIRSAEQKKKREELKAALMNDLGGDLSLITDLSSDSPRKHRL